GKVSKVLVKKGDHVTTGQPLFVIEDGDGAAQAPAAAPKEAPRAAEPPKPAAEGPRQPARQPAPPRQKPEPAQAPAPRPERDGGPPEAPAEATPKEEKVVPAGPATRRLARELGVNLRQVRGTARGGRVTQEDVRAFVRELASGAGVRGAALQAPPLPDF